MDLKLLISYPFRLCSIVPIKIITTNIFGVPNFTKNIMYVISFIFHSNLKKKMLLFVL